MNNYEEDPRAEEVVGWIRLGAAILTISPLGKRDRAKEAKKCYEILTKISKPKLHRTIKTKRGFKERRYA